jgi:hypothetical protein
MSKATVAETNSEESIFDGTNPSEEPNVSAQVRAAALEKWSVIALIIENEIGEANEKLQAAGVRARFTLDVRTYDEGEGDIASGLIVMMKKEAPLVEVRFAASRHRTLLLDISEITSAEAFELRFDECTRSLWRDIAIRMMRRAVLN